MLPACLYSSFVFHGKDYQRSCWQQTQAVYRTTLMTYILVSETSPLPPKLSVELETHHSALKNLVRASALGKPLGWLRLVVPCTPPFSAHSYPPSQCLLAAASVLSLLLPLLLPITLTLPSAWNGTDRKHPKVLVQGQRRFSRRWSMVNGEDRRRKVLSLPLQAKRMLPLPKDWQKGCLASDEHNNLRNFQAVNSHFCCQSGSEHSASTS